MGKRKEGKGREGRGGRRGERKMGREGMGACTHWNFQKSAPMGTAIKHPVPDRELDHRKLTNTTCLAPSPLQSLSAPICGAYCFSPNVSANVSATCNVSVPTQTISCISLTYRTIVDGIKHRIGYCIKNAPEILMACSPLSSARSSRLFIDVCPATSRATWLTTADSSPTPASDDCVLPTLEHWSSVAHKVLLAREHSLRQHLGSGTVCRLTLSPSLST